MLSRLVVRSSYLRGSLVQRATPNFARASAPFSSITYSGGQATEGQGGYYGSGGARVGADGAAKTTEHRPEMMALAADVNQVARTMEEVETLENLIVDETDKLSSTSIEIHAKLKKLVTAPAFMECLNRLEVRGEPAWGLSVAEHELITLAREKVNQS
eukprot:scaffold6794_cov46-Attheya_sp.AAC.5